MTTDVLLGQSYFLRFDAKLWAAMQPYAPLGALYAAGLLRQRGYSVALFDAMLAESEDEWDAALAEYQPRFAVLFEDNFNYLSKMCLLRMREAAFRMIDMARRRGCAVVVGGADATDHADLYLAAGADFVLRGEGDLTLVELLDRLTDRSDTPFARIPGLAFSPPRPLIRQLDELPFPAWDLVDVEKYRRVWLDRHGFFSMNMVTTRGCPYHCNWCAKPIWGQRYNVRSPQSVVTEMRWLKQAYAPDHIWFMDDIMGLKPGWLEEFGRLVQAQDAVIPFKCLSRADLMRDSAVAALGQAGCRTVWIGAESGSQKILDAMDKGTRVEQIVSATRRLKEAGIEVGFFLQFGYPGEERGDVEATLRMVRELMPDDIGMSVSYPLPGTKFYEAVKLQLGDKQNWQDSADLAMLYQGPFSTDFYRQLHVVLHKEFRARKMWRAIRAGQRRTGQERQVSIKQVARMVYYGLTLPLERRKLDRLARSSERGLGALPSILTPEQAATPSAQEA